jgi:hypothetical protein
MWYVLCEFGICVGGTACGVLAQLSPVNLKSPAPAALPSVLVLSNLGPLHWWGSADAKLCCSHAPCLALLISSCCSRITSLSF